MRYVSLTTPRSSHAVLYWNQAEVLFSYGQVVGISYGGEAWILNPAPSLTARKHVNQWCNHAQQIPLLKVPFEIQVQDVLLTALLRMEKPMNSAETPPRDPQQLDAQEQAEEEELEALNDEENELEMEEEEDDDEEEEEEESIEDSDRPL